MGADRELRWFRAVPLLLGLGVAAAAVLGPLLLDQIRYRNSAGAIAQLEGGEIVSLVVAAPLALASAALWRRRRLLAAAFGIGPGLYAVYMYTQYVLAGQYDRYAGNVEQFFPLFLALIILGWATVIGSWRILRAAPLPVLPAALRYTLAGWLVALGLLFAAAWAGTIADVLRTGGTPAYRSDPNLFWLVRVMDLGFVIPAGLITAFGLLRRATWSTRVGYGLVGLQTLLSGAVAGMAVMMAARHDPEASRGLMVASLVSAAAFAAIFVAMLRIIPSAPGAIPSPRATAANPP